MVIDKLSTESAFRVLAETDLEASNISGFLFVYSINDGRAGIVNKCFACWSSDSIKKITELPLDKISYILVVNQDIVLEDLGENSTDKALVCKTTGKAIIFMLVRALTYLEVHVRTFFVHSLKDRIYFFKFLSPARFATFFSNEHKHFHAILSFQLKTLILSLRLQSNAL